MSNVVIENSPDLWDAVSRRAGFQKHGYDAEVVTDIKVRLGIPASDNLKTALVRDGTPVDRLLHAVLNALQPFSRMLSDLLELYEWVGATAADDPNLRVRFSFDTGANDEYSFDVNAFREHQRR